MTIARIALVAGLAVTLAGQTMAQSVPNQNPSFELTGFTAGGVRAYSNNSDAEARARTATDGLLPAVTPRTGLRCIELQAPIGSTFVGYTTDIRDFFTSGFPFFDVNFDYDGGDVVIRGWYRIPADSAVNFTRNDLGDVTAGAPAAISLNVKGARDPNQNNASLDPWTVQDAFVDRLIFGHTDGEWREYVSVWTIADIRARFLTNGFDPIVDGKPNRIKITIGRFGYGTTDVQGTIFWDDITYQQLPAVVNTCFVDFNSDGFLNQEDLGGFLTAFLDESVPSGPSGTNAAPCPGEPAPYDTLGYAADYNRDCTFNQEDLSGYLTDYFGESENPTNCVPG